MGVVGAIFFLLFIICLLFLGVHLGRVSERSWISRCSDTGLLYNNEYYICKASEYSNLLNSKRKYEELKGIYDEIGSRDDWRWRVFKYITSFGGYSA